METKRKKEKTTHKGVLSYMDYLEKDKYASGKKGTASLYKATRNQFALFIGQRKLNLKKVNTQLINDFVDYLQSLCLSRNSISNYTSILRAVYKSPA